MLDLWHPYFLAFVPLFVAIDAIGVLPFYLALTDGLTLARRAAFLRQAVLTALVVALLFMVGAKLIFRLLGITEDDFRVAGGLLLLVMSVSDILFAQTAARRQPDPVSGGVVPLGVPLIIGPAALTTILISVDSYGYQITSASLLTNLLLAWLIFHYSTRILRLLGPAGAKACSKVASLFLAAIAIMMIRKGVVNLIHLHFPGTGA
jgi:multiple antibiotic resistance protein